MCDCLTNAAATQNSISPVLFLFSLKSLLPETGDPSTGQMIGATLLDLTLGPITVVASLVEGVVRLAIAGLAYLFSLPFGEESSIREYASSLLDSVVYLDDPKNKVSALHGILCPFILPLRLCGCLE